MPNADIRGQIACIQGLLLNNPTLAGPAKSCNSDQPIRMRIGMIRFYYHPSANPTKVALFLAEAGRGKLRCVPGENTFDKNG
jgi:hypothetical protein